MKTQWEGLIPKVLSGLILFLTFSLIKPKQFHDPEQSLIFLLDLASLKVVGEIIFVCNSTKELFVFYNAHN